MKLDVLTRIHLTKLIGLCLSHVKAPAFNYHRLQDFYVISSCPSTRFILVKLPTFNFQHLKDFGKLFDQWAIFLFTFLIFSILPVGCYALTMATSRRYLSSLNVHCTFCTVHVILMMMMMMMTVQRFLQANRCMNFEIPLHPLVKLFVREIVSCIVVASFNSTENTGQLVLCKHFVEHSQQ